MKRSAQFRQKFAAHRTKAEAILAAADAETGALSAEQQKEYDGLKAQMDTLAASIKREEEHEEADRVAKPMKSHDPIYGTQPRAEGQPSAGFRNHVEFFESVVANAGQTSRENVGDERLRPLAVAPDPKDRSAGGELAFAVPKSFGLGRDMRAAVGSDEQGVYTDSYGGFTVNTVQGAPRQPIGFEGDPSDGRCEVIPMAAPVVEMDSVVDKDHANSVVGGLTVTRRPETGSMNGQRQQMEKITMKAASAYGLSFVTEELLQDSPISWTTRVANAWQAAFAAFKLQEKLRGKGGAERVGILTALESAGLGPTLTIAKEGSQAPASILYTNTLKVRAQMWGYSQAIWMANHDTYPQLATLAIPVGTGGTAIYQQSGVEDRPDMLLGRPIFYTEYASTVGQPGDLICWNPTQYMEGEYQPVTFAESTHVRFLNAERALRFMKRDCGAPSWKVPLTPNQSTKKLSPSIILATR